MDRPERHSIRRDIYVCWYCFRCGDVFYQLVLPETTKPDIEGKVISMPRYSTASVLKLTDCHEDLQRLFREVIKHFDNTIITGHRDKEAQEAAYREGRSQVRFPHGKHNKLPSDAVDSAPYPINWEDRERFHYSVDRDWETNL